MTRLQLTDRTRLRRRPDRGSYELDTIHAIVDEALICHVGFELDGHPAVIPTAHWREGNELYLHGSRGSGLMRAIRHGAEVCVTITLLDGLVLARSGFHHSLNYRSVIAYGRPDVVEEPADALRALRSFIERLAPGRWEELRPVNDDELRQTQVAVLSLDEASAKIRKGGPIDDEADYAHPVWAGVVPIAPGVPAAPVPDERLPAGVPLPSYLKGQTS